MQDEYASVNKIFYLDDEHKWYELKQSWFKGMSNSSTSLTVWVKYSHSPTKYCRTCSRFQGVYNELFDMGIHSMQDLISFFFNKANKKLAE